MLRGKRLLVVEQEFLVAIDIQQILEGANVERTVFARTADEAGALHPRFGEFDIAVVEIPYSAVGPLPLVEGLLEAGVAVVLTTLDSAYRYGYPAHPDVPVLTKPFAEETLVMTCREAEARGIKDYES